MPVRGIGEHEVELVGVAERVSKGDQIVMLIYGLNDAYVASSSRDTLPPVVMVSGSIQVPMQGALPALTAQSFAAIRPPPATSIFCAADVKRSDLAFCD